MHNDLDLTIAQIIKKYDLLKDRRKSKSFGQHFLCDSSLLRKIVHCALPFDNNDIIEIGPGPCGLTREIAEYSRNNVFCIEKDKNLKKLHENFQQNTKCNVKFIYEDALNIKPQSLTKNKIIIISNLPYNVGTQIFLNILGDFTQISKMVLMFQKEVADRICADIGTKTYGRLSIISQLLCHVEKIFDISNKAFFPEPKVTSTVIKVTPKKNQIINIKKLERLTEKCFQFRRKTIYTILKNLDSQTEIDKILNECQIDKQSRPENISPEKFLELSEKLL